MAEVALWWLAVELLGLVALPAALLLFRNLPDRGYAFSKPLAILVLAYLSWILGLLHVLPNTQWSIVLLAAVLAALSAGLFWRRRGEMLAFLKQHLGLVVATEVLFAFAFVFWAAVRAYTPEIAGTEKPMDFAFLNGILRSRYFPPNDPWLSSHSISYYYFGHLMMAMLTKLTGVLPAVGYNLGVALVFALTALGAFGVVYNLVRHFDKRGAGRAIGFGLVAAGLVVLAGNLEGVLELAYAHGVGSQSFWQWLGIKGMEHPYHSAHWYPTDFWWWWRSSRVIDTLSNGVSLDYTIQETPSFSFLLGDLHPHVMALPFVLMALGFCLNTYLSNSPLGLGWLKRSPLHYLAVVLSIGALGFLNSWDLPTYLLLFIIAAFFASYFRNAELNGAVFKEVIVTAVLLGLGAVILYLPFYGQLQTQAQGILPVRSPGTRAVHYFIVWGAFLFLAVSLALLRLRYSVKGWTRSWVRLPWLLLFLLPLALWALLELAVSGVTKGAFAAFGVVADKKWALLPLIIILAVALLVLVGIARRASKDEQHRSYLFALVLAFLGLYLTFGVELFYIWDIFGSRMNTVFKFYYQAWVLLAIAGALGLYYLSYGWRPKLPVERRGKAAWWLCCGLLLAGVAIFPVAGIWSRATEHGGAVTLNGLAYLQRQKPGDYQAIQWLNQHVAGSPVILEAVGPEWSDYGRIASNTGLPTVLGWAGHERQWRGSDRPYAGREQDVAEIYRSQDASRVQSLLEKYDVQYVYLGDLERQSYGPSLGKGLEAVTETAYDSSGVTIYKVKGDQSGL